MPHKNRVPKTMLGKVMDLTVRDRLIIIQLLPHRANLASQMISKHILAKVQIPAEEKKEIEWTEEANRTSWDEKKAKVLEIKFTSTEIDFLRAQIKEWDEKKLVPLEFLDTLLAIQGLNDIPEPEEEEQEIAEAPAEEQPKDSVEKDTIEA